MAFEITRCEGWGRLGIIFGKKGFKTPNILQTHYYDLYNPENSSHDFWLTFDYEKDKFFTLTSLKSVRTDKNLKDVNNEDLKLNCFIYPSLQMQNKIKEDISEFQDLFPTDIVKVPSSTTSYHLIPWDLPTVHLGHYDKYLDMLNKLDIHEFNEDIKLMLNIPLSQSILELKLPHLKSSVIKAVCLGDISSLLTHPTLLVKYLARIKAWIPPNIVIYAPGIPSSYIPILVYLGVDLFDLQFLTSEFANNNVQNDLILEQNTSLDSFFNVLHLTRTALEIGKLRDLTRIYANSFPPLKAILRIIDRKISLEEGTPIYRSSKLYCTDETDFFRPEVSRFRHRVKNRYFPSSEIIGFIFLPCSAKKPYSKSKSHQLFREVIQRTLKKKFNSIEEIILTSPLGLVPRDLEYTFPAAHYDIPVTGEWSEVEKEHLKEDICIFLDKISPNTPLVGFLSGTERKVLEEACNEKTRCIYFLNENNQALTSKEMLESFSQLIQQVFSDINVKSKKLSNITFLRTIADFQFGKGIGSILIPDDAIIQGRKELGIRVKLNEEHLLTFRPETGFLTLSLAAGRRLLNLTTNTVVFDGNKIEGSTIFTNAIIKADNEIRPNEEVLITNKDGDLLAVGTSHLSGDLLVKMNRGKGVSIRKKVN